MSAEGPVRKPDPSGAERVSVNPAGAERTRTSSEPPDVDSLMSQLDGESPDDPISQPGSVRRPSAADLLGGRGRRTKRTIRVPDDAVPAGTPPPALTVRRTNPPPLSPSASAPAPPMPTPSSPISANENPLANVQVAPVAAKELLERPSLFDNDGRITPQRIISVGGEGPSPFPATRSSPPMNVEGSRAAPAPESQRSSVPLPLSPTAPLALTARAAPAYTAPANAPQIANLDAQVKEAMALLDRDDFDHADDISVADEEQRTDRVSRSDVPPSNEESLADEELEVVAAPEPSRKLVTAPNPPPRRLATAPVPVVSATLPSVSQPSASLPPTALPLLAGLDPTSQPSIVAAAAATASTPAVGTANAGPITGPTSNPTDSTGEIKKKKRQWFEDLFNDDYARTVPKLDARFVEREVGFIEDALGCDKGATILDVGCGPGEQAVALAARGYEVIGIDLSLAMLARAADEAADKNQRINFLQGDMRDLTFDEAFDGIYCWGTTFGYFDDQKNAEVIQKIHKALRRGGRFLLDVVNRDYIVARMPSMVWFEGEGCVCMDDAQLNAITSRLVVKRTMMMEDGRQREIEYSMRLYALHELGKLLHENGFRVAEASGDTSTPGTYFGAESPRILILAEKR